MPNYKVHHPSDSEEAPETWSQCIEGTLSRGAPVQRLCGLAYASLTVRGNCSVLDSSSGCQYGRLPGRHLLLYLPSEHRVTVEHLLCASYRALVVQQ